MLSSTADKLMRFRLNATSYKDFNYDAAYTHWLNSATRSRFCVSDEATDGLDNLIIMEKAQNLMWFFCWLSSIAATAFYFRLGYRNCFVQRNVYAEQAQLPYPNDVESM